ncbi:unnamed protein product [Ectocarpus sp. CCAP 1310/34]|nr:unnamed protein product [Ectocarpus sp. CCAP 1310/34]
MSSAGDEESTAASGEQIRPPVQEARDAELASLQLQTSQLAALVEESVKKKEPGSVVADAASRGGWVAAPGGQEEPMQELGGGGEILQQQARDDGQGPRQLLEGGWASRSGANRVGPAAVGPGIGPDYGEARGLNPPGEIPVIRGDGEYLDGCIPPEYQQAKLMLETTTALDRAEIVRIVTTVHARLPEGRQASKGQRRAEHALLVSDGSGGGGAPGLGSGGNQKGREGGVKAGGGGGGGGGGDDDAGSMCGRCFRCGKKGHQVADCTVNKPMRCETCKGYRHDKSKCPAEGAVLVVEVPAGGRLRTPQHWTWQKRCWWSVASQVSVTKSLVEGV